MARYPTAFYMLIASVQFMTTASPSPKTKLTITVANTDYDGTYLLECHPIGGNHPDPCQACAKLDTLDPCKDDPFAPVPPETSCTEQYGGPQTASINGTWKKQIVDEDFQRTDGCEITRWDKLVPLLPPASGEWGNP